tara:strand:- start:220 stop:651 length:432 start_codon:yes stop_codon:yes gene_type:complete
MYAQNIDLTPLINLDELQPSYDQEIIDYDKIDASEDQKFFIKEGKNYDQSFATISLLNKITAKVSTLDIRLKQNYLFEELKIYAIDCYNSEPLEKKETAVYLNIYNDASNEKIFNGWMIKSLPSISSMEHPIYDIWIDSCYKL